MIEIDSLSAELNDGVAQEYTDPNFLWYMQIRANIAQAEQLKRIADILDAVADSDVVLAMQNAPDDISVSDYRQARGVFQPAEPAEDAIRRLRGEIKDA